VKQKTKIMKKAFTIIALVFAGLLAYSQEPPPDAPKNEKVAETIEALKVAFITKELELNATEAQQFWPAYNSFSTEVKKARQEHKDDDIAFEEKRVGIMKKYRENFRKILNNEDRVKRCFKAEPKFHNILRREWQHRQNKMPQRRQGPPPNRQGPRG
jgi:hypothetical protein